MNVATQVILSALVLILLGWSVYRESVIRELHAQRRTLYRRGKIYGMKIERKHWLHRRRVELINADRTSDVRPDSGPAARVTPIRIQRGRDT